MIRTVRCVWLGLYVLLVQLAVLSPSGASADEVASCVQVGWERVDATCNWTFAEYLEASSESSYKWALLPLCIDPAVGSTCAVQPCVSNGVPGFMYAVTRDGVQVGMTCATTDPGPSREQILQSFRDLTWPSSSINVQPAGGQTLVNLDTIFYTENIEPTAKTVSIAKRDVHIIATPVSYTWAFGDGATLTTTSPGAPHPSRDVTHVYTSTDDVEASVATTYSGKYKIGEGDWQDIGETLTVPGPEASLEVLEAKPQLVLR